MSQDSTPSSLEPIARWFDGTCTGVIGATQSSFVEFVVIDDATAARVRVGRIHFRGVVRRSRLRGSFRHMALADNHPLCLPYQAHHGRVTFHRGPRDGGQLLREMDLIASQVLQGWIHPAEFLNGYFRDQERLTCESFGQLVDGPMMLIAALLPVLRESGMEYRVFEDHRKPRTVQALTLDRMYVVAGDFRGEVVDAMA